MTQTPQTNPALAHRTHLAATVVEPTEQGWRALTDAGAGIDLPATALDGVRMLRAGQRVTIEIADEVVVRVSIG